MRALLLHAVRGLDERGGEAALQGLLDRLDELRAALDTPRTLHELAELARHADTPGATE